MKIIFLTVISGFFAMAAAAQQSINYMPDLGAQSPELDIYTGNTQNAPVIIYVHGGAWVAGSHKQVRLKPRYFLDEGYVFVSVGYTLVPDITVEGQLAQIDAAIGWVAQNIASYGGDPDNISLMGHSAGAHLVAMTGVRPLENAAPLIANGAIQRVISNDTRSYDVPRIAALSPGGQLPTLFARPFGNDPARWQQLSPIYNISAGRKPAFLVIYSGQGNAFVRQSFAQEFALALQVAGGQATLFDGQAYNHGQINQTIGRNNSITNAIESFLNGQR